MEQHTFKGNLKYKDMETIITNLITNEKTLFINSFPVVDNVVTYIILAKNKNSQLHNEALKERIINDYNLKECTSKVTSEKFCYCEEFDIYAKQII